MYGIIVHLSHLLSMSYHERCIYYHSFPHYHCHHWDILYIYLPAPLKKKSRMDWCIYQSNVIILIKIISTIIILKDIIIIIIESAYMLLSPLSKSYHNYNVIYNIRITLVVWLSSSSLLLYILKLHDKHLLFWKLFITYYKYVSWSKSITITRVSWNMWNSRRSINRKTSENKRKKKVKKRGKEWRKEIKEKMWTKM